MFDTLSNRLQGALGDLRKRGRLDEEAISRAMREVRLALLEADVNFEVVKGFVARVRERAVGQEVLKSVTPGQQVVKIVHDELTELMGSGDSRLAFASRARARRPPRPSLPCCSARKAGSRGSSPPTCSGPRRSSSSGSSASSSTSRSSRVQMTRSLCPWQAPSRQRPTVSTS